MNYNTSSVLNLEFANVLRWGSVSTIVNKVNGNSINITWRESIDKDVVKGLQAFVNGEYYQDVEILTNENGEIEETNIPEDLKNVISNDYILRYKDGTYIWEEELTDKFYEGLIDVKKYMQKMSLDEKIAQLFLLNQKSLYYSKKSPRNS